MLRRSRLPISQANSGSSLTVCGQALGADLHPSGIAKSVVEGPWTLTRVGIVGDEQGDRKRHGGLEKALHYYPLDHHAAWPREIGPHPLLGEAGAFGENLSASGWTEDNIHVGDVIRFSRFGAALPALRRLQDCRWIAVGVKPFRFDRIGTRPQFLIGRVSLARAGIYSA
jgi:MOSC domain-containing protein